MSDIREIIHRPNRRSIRIQTMLQLGPPLWIVAIDPGVTTGFAGFRCIRHDSFIELEVAQFRPEEFDRMVARIGRFIPKRRPKVKNPNPVIVYEQYVARPSRHGHLGAEAKRQLSPVAVMGQIEGFYKATNPVTGEFSRHMPTFYPQQASMMASFHDDRLKAMFPDIYKLTLNTAMPHARDALRHLLVYLKKHHFEHYRALKPPKIEE